MSDWGFYAFTMRQAYGDRLRKADGARLVRQMRASLPQCTSLWERIRAWLRPHLSALRARWQVDVQETLKEAASSKAGGSLIL